jgi:dUTP pyrophosphatase
MLPTLQIYIRHPDRGYGDPVVKLVDEYKRKVTKHNRATLAASHPDSGFDIICPNTDRIHVPPNTPSVKIPLGIKCAMFAPGAGSAEGTKNYSGCLGYYLYPRSSTGTKTTLRLANSVGIIDSGYRGELCAVFDNIGGETVQIVPGQRLVQVCAGNLGPFLIEIVEREEALGSTARGEGGFGSTGV